MDASTSRIVGPPVVVAQPVEIVAAAVTHKLKRAGAKDARVRVEGIGEIIAAS